MSIPIHWFIDLVDRSRSISTVDKDSLTYQVDRSRSISTVDKDSPTWEYGQYWRLIPIHLRRITVNCWSSMKNWHNFVVDFINDTCAVFEHLRTLKPFKPTLVKHDYVSKKIKTSKSRTAWLAEDAPRKSDLIWSKETFPFFLILECLLRSNLSKRSKKH